MMEIEQEADTQAATPPKEVALPKEVAPSEEVAAPKEVPALKEVLLEQQDKGAMSTSKRALDDDIKPLSWSVDIAAPIAIACMFAAGLSTQRLAYGLVFISLGGFGYVLWMLALFIPVFLSAGRAPN